VLVSSFGDRFAVARPLPFRGSVSAPSSDLLAKRLAEGTLPTSDVFPSRSIEDADEEPSPPAKRETFRTFVGRHYDFVWRLLRRLGVPPSDVDDAAQQVFMVACHRREVIADGAERSFLVGTALRVASTRRRTESRRCRSLGELLHEARAQTPMPDEELERRESLALLDEALSALGDELRRVFVLSDIEGLSGPEIASLERIPQGTVASRLRRARAAFAARVRELHQALQGEL
jgi:RNA polymerase sigma-70 factor (ECF subfamily)